MFSKESRERELAAELEGHLEMHIHDNLREGLTPEEALAVARDGGRTAEGEMARPSTRHPDRLEGQHRYCGNPDDSGEWLI